MRLSNLCTTFLSPEQRRRPVESKAGSIILAAGLI
jgi:hypothetical protein